MADDSPAAKIDQRIEELGDWRGRWLAELRALIKEADPDVVEEWKWRGVPTWYHGGKIICTGETYKNHVKVTFAKGASLDDPEGLFNSSLDGNVRRAIDFHEGDAIDAPALTALVRAAVALIDGGAREPAAPRGGACARSPTPSAARGWPSGTRWRPGTGLPRWRRRWRR